MPHNARKPNSAKESGVPRDLPLAILVREGGDEDTFLAQIEVHGDTLIFELDDGRTIALDRRELLDRAA